MAKTAINIMVDEELIDWIRQYNKQNNVQINVSRTAEDALCETKRKLEEK